MQQKRDLIFQGWKRWLKNSFVTLLLVLLSAGLSGVWGVTTANAARDIGLPSGNAITDGKALLRYALPIDNQPIRKVQGSLEDIANQLRGKRWGPIATDIKKAKLLLDSPQKILAGVPDDRQPQAETLLAQLKEQVGQLQTAAEAKNKEQTWIDRSKSLELVGQIEELMVEKFPFDIPQEYSYLPHLKGRATIQFTTNKGDLTVVVDGYSAPVTAGNFVDLVQRGFYDGLPFIRAEDSYFLQTGKPKDGQGFIDPETGKYRNVPLEVLARGDDAPTYGITLEDAGRYLDYPVLPFSSYGALAMARPEENPDGGSSQFFFFLFEPELTPAGRNLLDGRYSVFGYVTEGKEVLQELKAGDTVISAKVIQGAENLVPPSASMA